MYNTREGRKQEVADKRHKIGSQFVKTVGWDFSDV